MRKRSFGLIFAGTIMEEEDGTIGGQPTKDVIMAAMETLADELGVEKEALAYRSTLGELETDLSKPVDPLREAVKANENIELAPVCGHKRYATTGSCTVDWCGNFSGQKIVTEGSQPSGLSYEDLGVTDASDSATR